VRVFENIVLRKIYVPKKDELAGNRRRILLLFLLLLSLQLLVELIFYQNPPPLLYVLLLKSHFPHAIKFRFSSKYSGHIN